jgi:hypothetical protein
MLLLELLVLLRLLLWPAQPALQLPPPFDAGC